ncbi:MAG TPA: ABC transporter ATP-binding protein [Rhizomicrobium sp.]|nr:ABC transporter ATP-binding protein [Rhizomicrobium sp.]
MIALSFDKVSVRLGNRDVLQGVSATFKPGKVTGILGPNGAGKTTLLRVALGLLPVRSGAVTLHERGLKDWSREALARTIAYLPQGGDAHWPVRARDLVALGRLPHLRSFASLNEIDRRAIHGALFDADAVAFADRRIDELSAGERARVLFARALATGAQVLLADEPAAYLDPAHQLRLMRMLSAEAARGVAVAVTLHDLALASRHCDAVIVLHEGRIAAQGSPKDALTDAVLAQVFGIAVSRAIEPGYERAAVVPWALI